MIALNKEVTNLSRYYFHDDADGDDVDGWR